MCLRDTAPQPVVKLQSARIDTVRNNCYTSPMSTQRTFGEYVRRLRRAKLWDLQDVAQATGLSVSHLSRFENDHAVPSPEDVVKLASALDGNLEYMLEC